MAKVIRYDKLVRDKIPDLIASTGKQCVTETLSEEEYLKKLDEKLAEELAEFQQDHSLEELADLQEVILAAAAARGCSAEELEKIRYEKAKKRGGFEQRLMLRDVIED
ncbi:MAG: nucleoside triphosphate pyrophosphohydrolase [Erysipelotrichaceae bacterium]|nr:nucleoside triphosphate pyrophosphohydrolase [Erysipelotrichaceae bacterium]